LPAQHRARRWHDQRRGLSLSRWILLVLILAALGAPERASGQAKNASFNDAAGCS
jgi:hypothetical protein